MHYSSYEIKDYTPTHIEEVSAVQEYLYGISKDITIKYFQWKYEQNPHSITKEPLGKIAAYKGKIIGFRGFFPTKWYIGKKNVFMLSSSDVCVHPEHRRKGLFRVMTEEAIKDYYDYGYNFYLNLSSNQFSTPGDIKMGWKKLATRQIFRRCNLLSLLKYCFVVKGKINLNCFKINLGHRKNIEVSDNPKPEEIHKLHVQQNRNGQGVFFSRDIEFIKWKYKNNLRKYLFFYYNESEILKGYIVISSRRYTPKFTNKAEIIDFAWSDISTFESLLKYIVGQFPSNIFDLWNYNMNSELLSIFNRQNFSENNYTIKKQRLYQGDRYCLVRPASPDYTENDWFVGNRDMRILKNWQVGEISADDS